MLRVIAVLAPLVLGAVATAAVARDLETVERVDLERYLGRWYEIASYPAWFQRNCTAVTADYSRRDDGLIAVVNSCRKGSLDGRLKQARGRARVVDEASNARLEVSFFGPFWGPYWIIDLDPEYRWAVVGVPSRRYLWILSRTPTMDEATYAAIVDRLVEQGYDPERLNRTPQPVAGDGS
jgi:apolipoprotein D and lipocalin family protein